MLDMDGLLVDTEPLWLDLETEIMTRLGGTWTHADQAELLGGSLGKSIGYMLAKAAPTRPDGAGGMERRAGAAAGWPPPAQTVAEWMVGGMVARIADGGARPLPGAAELLAEIAAAGVPCALVTSSEQAIMDAVLAHSLAGAAFDVTVCAADVSRTKPDPEPYLVAARRLGADPARCVALEDSPNGVSSAEAAGCLVVAVPNVTGVPPNPGSPAIGSRCSASHQGAAVRAHRLVVSSLRDISLGWLADQVVSRDAPAC